MSAPPISPIFHEAEYVKRAKAGDGCAFLDLVRHFDRRVFPIARLITQNEKEAEDVCIRAFVKACWNLDDYPDNEGSTGGW